MSYVDELLSGLSAERAPGYHAGAEQATEPTALAAMALVAHGRASDVQALVDWLGARQLADGSLGVDQTDGSPAWPTGWSVLAWRAAQNSDIAHSKYQSAIDRAVGWMLAVEGSIQEHIERLGHDTSIKGWPWVLGTHAWVEPTAMNLLALRHCGQQDHLRARQAALLLVDRLLETGGCNYGNTVVFGQALRPHLEPTGMCLLALAGLDDSTGRVQKSVAYLESALNAETTSVSLSYALIGLAAHGRWPARADQWLESAARRTLTRDRSAYKLALLALAALGDDCPLIPRSRMVAA